jgi:hypothetical protein
LPELPPAGTLLWVRWHPSVVLNAREKLDNKAKDVDDYSKRFQDARDRLEAVRATIRDAAPNAEETADYGIREGTVAVQIRERR